MTKERKLPGLSAWGRVADYRLFQLKQRQNVQLYYGSHLSTDEVLEFGFQHVCVATGSHWRADGVSRQHVVPMPTYAAMPVFTPDDLMHGRLPKGRVVIFDDDHYYMGGVLAELCAQNGCEVTLVTPSAFVSDWTANTLEQASIHRRLVGLGVKILLNTGISAIHADRVETNCTYTDARSFLVCDAVVMVASRISDDALYHALKAREADWADAGIRSVKLGSATRRPLPQLPGQPLLAIAMRENWTSLIGAMRCHSAAKSPGWKTDDRSQAVHG